MVSFGFTLQPGECTKCFRMTYICPVVINYEPIHFVTFVATDIVTVLLIASPNSGPVLNTSLTAPNESPHHPTINTAKVVIKYWFGKYLKKKLKLCKTAVFRPTGEGLNFWMEGIIGLGSHIRSEKGSSVSSHPLLRAGVRAHPSAEDVGSTPSSVFYLPACRCLIQHQDGYLGLGSNTVCCLTSRASHILYVWFVKKSNTRQGARVETLYVVVGCRQVHRWTWDSNTGKLFLI